jgi:D-3-phosphoglycerate dehydrogenase
MKILVSDTISALGLEMLKSKYQVDYKPGLPPQELVEIVGDYEALLVRSGTKVTAGVIKAAKKLKVIGRAGAGVDNIDVENATEQGIVVINTPGANTVSTAEHTIAMLTALARNIPAAHLAYKSGAYKREKFIGVELFHKTLGIVGLGRIGSEVARRARAMGMRLMAYDPYITSERAEKVGVELTGLDQLLKSADFITFHLPLMPATRHMLGDKELALMKDGVRIINCARGGLIDEEALYRALVSGKVAGAALDVFEEENPAENKLFSLDNVIVTPHLGASTREAQENVSLQAAEQVLKALCGELVTSAVNLPGVSPEIMAEIKPYLPLPHLLGSFLIQLFGSPVEEVEIHYSGEIAAKLSEPMTTSCLIGMLQVILGEQVNYVNATRIIQSRGIRIKEIRSSTHKSYANHISLHVKSGEKSYTVAGAILDGGTIRIVQIGDHLIDVVPSRYMLVTTHYDRPGVVGKVGTLLGNENINIASMQVGRQFIGGEAVMVLQVDDPVSKAVLKKVAQLDVLHNTHFVELKSQDLIRG